MQANFSAKFRAALEQRLAALVALAKIAAHGDEDRDRVRAAIAAKEIEGVALESEPVRVYPQAGGGPNTTLAAKLLGFVNREGSGQ